MRNVSDKSRGNQNTHFMFSNFCSKILWKNIVEPDRPQKTTWRMQIACRIPKVTNTHSEYVIIIAYLLQEWLHESASALFYTYIACLFIYNYKTSCWKWM